MILNVFTIYDVKAAVYAAPFFAPTVGVAKRLCLQSMSADTTWAQFPDDFTLFHLGEFDDQSARFDPINPLPVCQLGELLRRPPRPSDELDSLRTS